MAVLSAITSICDGSFGASAYSSFKFPRRGTPRTSHRPCNRLPLSGGSMVRTCNFQPATRPGMNGQREAVQLNDRSHEIEAKAHACRASDLVGPVETAQHGLALLIADSGAGIADAHDGFIVAAHQFNVDPAAFRRKLDGIVDEVGDRLEEEIPIAAYAQLLLHPDPKLDTLVFGNRFVDIAYLL